MGVTVLGIQHNFYPRSPCGERPASRYTIGSFGQFLSTLSLRRATTHTAPKGSDNAISIHALLAESDAFFLMYH